MIGLSPPKTLNVGSGTNAATITALAALAPPKRLFTNPIIPCSGVGWKSGQTFESMIIVDPKDSTRLLQFYTGQYNGGHGGGFGLATAPVSDPTRWTDLTPVAPIIWDVNSGGVRLGSVFYQPSTDEIWLYGSIDNTVMNLYKTPANDLINWVSDGANPVWQPSQVVGVAGVTVVGNMGVLRVDATHYYGYYSLRSSSEGTLSSIRLCTSSDGKSFTDYGTNPLIRVQAGTYYSTYLEGMNQAFAAGGEVGIVTSTYDGTHWTCGLAIASSPTGPFTMQSAPVFSCSADPAAWDSGLVASPSIFNLNGRWYIFYAGTKGAPDYNNAYWSIGMAEF